MHAFVRDSIQFLICCTIPDRICTLKARVPNNYDSFPLPFTDIIEILFVEISRIIFIISKIVHYVAHFVGLIVYHANRFSVVV